MVNIKRSKRCNKYDIAKIRQNEYKDVLLYKKCFAQSEIHRIGAYEIKKFLWIILMTKFIFLIIELMSLLNMRQNLFE